MILTDKNMEQPALINPHLHFNPFLRRKVDMNRSPDIGICPDDELR